MGTELMIQFSKVGWTKKGRRLKREPSQAKWLVRRVSGGRPGLVTHNGVPLLVDYEITPEELKELLDYAPGVYRLYAADEDGFEFEDTDVAEFEIRAPVAESVENEHLYQMFSQFISFVESKDVLLADVTKAVIQSNKELHSGNVEMLNTASTTINVATGIERPEIDLEAMAKYVAKDVQERKEQEHQKQAPWHVQVLNGPFGKGLLANLNSFVESLAKATKAK